MNKAVERTIKAEKQDTWVLYDQKEKREVLAKEYYAKQKLNEGSRYKFIRKLYG